MVVLSAEGPSLQRFLKAQGVEALILDEMIFDSGSQQALDFLGRVFLNPG